MRCNLIQSQIGNCVPIQIVPKSLGKIHQIRPPECRVMHLIQSGSAWLLRSSLLKVALESHSKKMASSNR
jgi:hypothetical protein